MSHPLQTHTVLILKLPNPLKCNCSVCKLIIPFLSSPPLNIISKASNKCHQWLIQYIIFWQPTFCRLYSIRFSLDAPSLIPAASLFWACHHIYYVSHLCVAFLVVIVLLYSSRNASTIHVTVYTCEASFCVCSKYGASNEFRAFLLY